MADYIKAFVPRVQCFLSDATMGYEAVAQQCPADQCQWVMHQFTALNTLFNNCRCTGRNSRVTVVMSPEMLVVGIGFDRSPKPQDALRTIQNRLRKAWEDCDMGSSTTRWCIIPLLWAWHRKTSDGKRLETFAHATLVLFDHVDHHRDPSVHANVRSSFTGCFACTNSGSLRTHPVVLRSHGAPVSTTVPMDGGCRLGTACRVSAQVPHHREWRAHGYVAGLLRTQQQRGGHGAGGLLLHHVHPVCRAGMAVRGGGTGGHRPGGWAIRTYSGHEGGTVLCINSTYHMSTNHLPLPKPWP